MVNRGEIMQNYEKLIDMKDYLMMLIDLHQTALFTWKISGIDIYLEQAKIDVIIARYQTLKGQLATKYEELL